MSSAYERFDAANIPPAYHSTINLGKARDRLKSFLSMSQTEGSTLLDSFGRSNQGLCVKLISHDAEQELVSRNLLYALAKSCILHGYKTYVYDLCDFINGFNHPVTDGHSLYTLNNAPDFNFADCIVIQRFIDVEPCPFTDSMRFQLENFFRKCLDRNVTLIYQCNIAKPRTELTGQ